MEANKFRALIKKILDTEEEEISCSQCFDLVSEYVEMEVSGKPIPPNFQKVKQHLDQCRACEDEYVILRDLVQVDSSDPETE